MLWCSLPDQTIRLDPSITIPSQGQETKTPKKRSVAGPAAGGAIGGVVLLTLVAGAIIWYKRKRRTPDQGPGDHPGTIEPFGLYGENTSAQAQNSNPTLSASTPVTDTKYSRQSAYHVDLTLTPTFAGSSSGSGSAGVATTRSGASASALRNEVEELRREMMELKRNPVIAGEAPPSYAPDHP